MRKTGLLIALMCLPTAVRADPPVREAAKNLGYSEEVLKDLPKGHLPRAPRDRLIIGGSSTPEAGRQSAESLPPRLYQVPEPSTMIPTLIRLHQRQPGSAKITRKLALTFMQAHQPQEALHWFTQTYMRDRNDLSALWNMGALSMQLKDHSGAHAFFEEYARLDKTSPWGRMAARYIKEGFSTFSDNSQAFPGLARTGYVLAGSQSASNSIMIIDGKVAEPPAQTPVSVPFGRQLGSSSNSDRSKSANRTSMQAERGFSNLTPKIPPASTLPLAHASIETASKPAAIVPPAQPSPASATELASGTPTPPANP